MIPFDVSENLLRRSLAKSRHLQHSLASAYAGVDAYTLGYIYATDLQIALAEGIECPDFRRELAEGLRAGLKDAATAPLTEDSLPTFMD